MSRRTIKRGAGRRWVEGKSLRLADEVRYIQDKVFDHDSRVVSFGQLLLFSSNIGDVWLLVSDKLAARVARDGDPEFIHLEEADASFAIGWKGSHRIDGSTFIFTGREPGRVTTILGYPTQAIAREISNIFG